MKNEPLKNKIQKTRNTWSMIHDSWSVSAGFTPSVENGIARGFPWKNISFFFSRNRTGDVNHSFARRKPMPFFTTGFTLVETLVAISIFSFALVFLLSSVGGGLNNLNSVKNRLTGSYLAEEGIELVRAIRDNDVIATNAWHAGFLSHPNLVSCSSAINGCNIEPSTLEIFPCSSAQGCVVRYNQNAGYYGTGSSSSIFSRKITIEEISPTEVRVTSVVSWNDGLAPRKISLQENLTCWQNAGECQ